MGRSQQGMEDLRLARVPDCRVPRHRVWPHIRSARELLTGTVCRWRPTATRLEPPPRVGASWLRTPASIAPRLDKPFRQPLALLGRPSGLAGGDAVPCEAELVRCGTVESPLDSKPGLSFGVCKPLGGGASLNQD